MNPRTMTPEEFSKRAWEIAAQAESLPIGKRAPYLDQLGDLFVGEGFDALAQTWYDAAAYARRTYGG